MHRNIATLIGLTVLWALLHPAVAWANEATAEQAAADAPVYKGEPAHLERGRPARIDAAADAHVYKSERLLDSIWLVSSRHLGCPGKHSGNESDFRYYQRDPSNGWGKSNREQFLVSADHTAVTCCYVHGNRIEWSEAFSRGMMAYRALVRSAPDAPPIRFVIWSWPSSRICGVRRDAQVKAARAHAESYYLASFLSSLPNRERLGLIGFSFGGRIICGAAHLLAGGHLGQWDLSDTGEDVGRNIRVALFASASHNCWLLPGRYHGRCLEQVDQLLNFYNPCDPVLRFYPRLERRSRPQALGRTGFPWTGSLGENADRFTQRNVSCILGRTHGPDRYFGSSSIMSDVSAAVLWMAL